MGTVSVDFRVGGIAETERAFRTIAQAAESARRSTQRNYDDETRMAQRAAREKEREAEKSAKIAERLREKGYRENARIAAEEVKAVEKAANEKLKIEERWARMTLSAAHKTSLDKQRMLEQEVRAHERMLQQKHQAEERYGRLIGSSIGRSMGGMASTAMRLGGTALSLGGGFGIADAIQGSFAAQRTAAQIVNAVTSAGAPPTGANVGNILSKAGATAITTGMSKDEVAKGVLAYTRSARGGNFEGAMGNAEFFAKLAKTTGTDIEQIGEAAGTLQSQNAELGKDPKKMQQMLLNAYAQSKSGSVSMKDAASQFGKLGSTRGFYAGDEATNQLQLMGLGQIAASSGGKEEIGTYAKNIALQSSKHKNRDVLKSFGVKFNASGEIESTTKGRTAIEDLVAKTFTGTKGDMTKIADIFGTRGLPVFESLKSGYKSGGAEGVLKQMREVTGASMSSKDLDAQFEQVMSTPAEKFAQAQQRVTQMIEEKLTPALEKFADWLSKPENIAKIQKVIDKLGDLAEWFINNPIKGLGAIMLAGVTKDLAAAGIGKAIEMAISKAGTGNSIAITAAAVSIIATKQAVDQAIDDDRNRRSTTPMGHQTEALNLMQKIKNGTATPEEMKRAESLRGELGGDIKALKPGNESWFVKYNVGDRAREVGAGLLTQGLSTPFYQSKTQENQKRENQTQDAKTQQQLIDTLDKLTRAIQTNPVNRKDPLQVSSSATK